MALLPTPFSHWTTYRGHSGIDFPKPNGTRFYASGPGVVRRLSKNAAGGNWIVIKYDAIPYEVGYAHMRSHRDCPRPGTRVSRGTFLGYVGDLGTRVTGPHIHLEILGQATDSAVWRYFRKGTSVSGGTPSSTGGSTSSTDTKNRQSWLNQARGEKLVVDGIAGPATIAAYKRYQTFLRKYGYTGSIDGKWGSGTQAAHQKYYDSVKPAAKLTVDGKWGSATTRALQKVLKVTVDGKLGPKTYTALQKRLVALGHKIVVDGKFGPNSIKALQTFLLGASQADGKLGPVTIKSLQRYLNAGGTFTPKASTPSKNLTVDGIWGAATTSALQKNLKVTVDGKMGPVTVKALQKALGVTQDGKMGPKTNRALQVAVGVTADGIVGPKTVKALQTFLNAGKTFTAVVVPDPEPVVTYPKPAAPTYPGASWWDHSSNSTPRRAGDKVQYFVIHHIGASQLTTTEGDRKRFMTSNDRSVSPNWLISRDGTVSEIVPPDKYRAWTSGKFDFNAVTVETQDISVAPTWGISEESHIAIAKLVAWAADRYGFPIDRTHVIGHREVPGSATICPGPGMDLDRIVTLAKAFAAEGETSEEPKPETPKDEWVITLSKTEAVALAGLLDKLRDLLP